MQFFSIQIVWILVRSLGKNPTLLKIGAALQTLGDFLVIAQIQTVVDLSKPSEIAKTVSNSKARSATVFSIPIAMHLLHILEPFLLEFVLDIQKKKDDDAIFVKQHIGITYCVTGEA